MWRLRGKCHRCGLPMVLHFFIWLQSFFFKLLNRPSGEGKRVVLIKKALEYFDEFGPPLIIEPMYRHNSRHLTKGIITRSELVQAFYLAQDVSPWVLLRKDNDGSGSS